LSKEKDRILKQFSAKTGQIAVLIDPEKTHDSETLSRLIQKAEFAGIDYFFIGGSTVSRTDFQRTIHFLKQNTSIPLVIFPGASHQISEEADALLYLSLVSGRNPDFLITHHIQSSLEVLEMEIEVLPTAYLLVDGGKQSSVAYVSQTSPIPRDQVGIALSTAVAAHLQGKKIVFLDAGSGALQSVPCEFVREIKKHINTPILVGGGIKSLAEIEKLTTAGTNVLVIGNKIEEEIDFLLDIRQHCLQNSAYK
jgi:phosphoglycerol geranylgeranyltransferase